MYSFSKGEKLSSKVLIDKVFESKRKLVEYPLHLTYCYVDTEMPFAAQVLLSVSKKKMKKAVQRNRVKRILRESYRLHKHIVYNALNTKQKKIALAILYTSTEMPEFKEIESKIILILERLAKEIVKPE
jgi:ribonuclease P protein component